MVEHVVKVALAMKSLLKFGTNRPDGEQALL